jgi:tight adherence protein B
MTLYVAATFFGVLGLIVGIYWVLVAVPESRQRGHMERRLRSQPKPKARLVGSVVKPEDRLSSVGPLNAVLGRMARLSRPLRMVITQADLSITVGTLVLTCGVAGLSAWLLAAWFSGLWWLGLALGPVVGYLPLAAVRQRASRRILKFEEQFPDALDLASRALRAGHAFTTGLAMVAEEAPQPVAAEFRTLYEQQSFGMPLPDAMRAFAERIPLLDARFFVTAVLTQRDVRVLTAHARITGFVLAALPPVLAVAFLITSPDHIMMLVKDPLGVKMIVAAATLQILGTLVIRRLVDIEY